MVSGPGIAGNVSSHSTKVIAKIIIGPENRLQEPTLEKVPNLQIKKRSSEEQKDIVMGSKNPPKDTILRKVPDLRYIIKNIKGQKDIIKRPTHETIFNKLPNLKIMRKNSKKQKESNKTATEKKNYLVDYEYDEITEKYTCKTCQKVFKNKTTIISHKRLVCNVQPKHECIFCDYRGRSPSAVRHHIGHKHNRWPKLGNDGKWIY